MHAFIHSFALAALSLFLCIAAQAGPAMFSASFIMHAFGNDVTSGTAYPNNTSIFWAWPLGHDCQSPSPYTTNGGPSPRYCPPSIIRVGSPATGSGPAPLLSAAVGAPLALPQSAFGVTASGLLPNWYYFLQSKTYATFDNAAGSFFAGGGPAAGKGQTTHFARGQQRGTWIIRAGERGFGGVLGLLGRFGARREYLITGKAGTYRGRTSWNMIPALGRPQYATPIGYNKQGKTTAWQNPYDNTGVFVNNVNGNKSTFVKRGTGTLWTTGSVTVYATRGSFTTILHRAGHDTTVMHTTPMGTTTVRNLQLVTPALTHWSSPGFQDHTGHIGILTLQITPEPGALLLLAVGIGALTLLYGTSLRR